MSHQDDRSHMHHHPADLSRSPSPTEASTADSQDYSASTDQYSEDYSDDIGPADSASTSHDGYRYGRSPYRGRTPQRQHRIQSPYESGFRHVPAHGPPMTSEPSEDWSYGRGSYNNNHQPPMSNYYRGGAGGGGPYQPSHVGGGGYQHTQQYAPPGQVVPYNAYNTGNPFVSQFYGGDPRQSYGELMQYGQNFYPGYPYPPPGNHFALGNPPPAPATEIGGSRTPGPPDPVVEEMKRKLAALEAARAAEEAAKADREREEKIRREAERELQARLDAQKEAQREFERKAELHERQVREKIETERLAEREREKKREAELADMKRDLETKMELERAAAEERQRTAELKMK